MTPPYPSMISEGPASGSEGTIFRGSEGTHSAPRKTLPLPASPPPRPQPAATPLQSQTPATPPDQPVPALRPVVQQPPAKASDRMVTLDFNNVDLQTFIKFISELTGRNFVIDEKVQGKVSVISPSKISVDDAYQVFLTVLDLKGFTAVTENKVIKIFPSREAKQSGVSVVTDTKPLPPDENYETRIVRLKYISASEISRLIAPLISKDGSSIPYSQSNALILTDIKSNMAKLLSLISELDMESPKGKGGIYVYYLQNAIAEDMAKVLANLTSRVPAKPPAGQPPHEAVVHF